MEENKTTIKESLNSIGNFFAQKKVVNIIVIILFLALLISSSYIRLQNLPLLKDATSGKYIPLALDPFYFLRVAETQVNNGFLPNYDILRNPAINTEFSKEILPQVIIIFWQVGKLFNNSITLEFIDVISPIIFFILGLIAFFFLIYILTKSKIIALLSSIFLGFIPIYLYRTMAGFADHEAIGMLMFFITMLCYSIGIKYFDKNKNNIKVSNVIIFSLLIGLVSALTIASWGGIANFIFIIIPLSFFILWLMKTKESYEKDNKKPLLYLILFYTIWLISSMFFGSLFGFSIYSLLLKFALSTNCLITLFVLLFLLCDFSLIMKIQEKPKQKYRAFYSLIFTIILGIIFLFVFIKNPLLIFENVWNKILHPFGLGRVGLTIAENAQPYLNDLISQMGKFFFYMFVMGLVFLGIEVGKKIEIKKEKIIFNILWCLMFIGILFHRISSTSALNGINFISQLFYIGSILFFVYYSAKLYFNNKLKINSMLIIISTIMFVFIISGTSAIRFFFVIAPFICFSSAFFVIKTIEHLKDKKDDLIKILLIVLIIIGIIGTFYNGYVFYKSSEATAKYTGPSANIQWQNTMSWVRENTKPNDIFVHWWDYGYWVQYLGERPTVTDGGHDCGYWDYLIGRYLLTTPNPETALSFIKTHNVSYLLIDSNDLGKYSAYSKIGGDVNNDRFSYISSFISDKSKMQETSNLTIRIYEGVAGVDEDIIYEENNSKIFIPGPTYDEIGNPNYVSYIGGLILKIENINGTLIQPEGVFIYNNEQIKIPIRYAYFNGQMIDFEKGLDVVFFVYPRVYDNNGQIQIDYIGAGLYLSPKVSKSLFAQLYLLNNSFGNYNTIKLVHSERDQVSASLKMQGADLGDFIYYNGFRGPIKIWNTQEIPKNILFRKEFLETSGGYAELDNLRFTK